MANLCGAWALSGGPITVSLSEPDRSAMLARLPAQRVRQFSRGPLWLAAAALAHEGESCLALDGRAAFPMTGPRDLRKLLTRRRSRPDGLLRLLGHHILVCADAAGGRLELRRDPSGGALLFYALCQDLLLFSSSAEPLLAHARMRRELDAGAAAEFLLNGFLFSGPRTLFSGIHQLLPGQVLEASPDGLRLKWPEPDERPPDREDPTETPAGLRKSLQDVVKLAVGSEPRVAVSLSGGLDSSAVAACAADLLGAQNVHAFTYEFRDPLHLSEAPLAGQLCRRLGIPHHIISIGYDEYRNAVLETAWRVEDPSSLVRAARIPLLARAVRAQGLSLCLDGFGMEDLYGMGWSGYLDNLGRALPRVPQPDWTLRFWRAAVAPRGPGWDLLRWAASRVPRIKPPPPDLFYIILCALQDEGTIRDVAAFYPPGLRDSARAAVCGQGMRDVLQAIAGAPLSTKLQYLKYCRAHKTINACLRPLAGSLGVDLAAPAMLLHPPCAGLGLRPALGRGRPFFQEAMRGVIPEQTLERDKVLLGPSQYPTAISTSWHARIMRDLAPALVPDRERLKSRFFPMFDTARGLLDEDRVMPGYISFGPMNLDLLALWHRLHIESRPPDPPDWRGLTGG